MRNTTAYDDGWTAGYEDELPECPYAETTEEYKEWWEGYTQGSRDS